MSVLAQFPRLLITRAFLAAGFIWYSITLGGIFNLREWILAVIVIPLLLIALRRFFFRHASKNRFQIFDDILFLAFFVVIALIAPHAIASQLKDFILAGFFVVSLWHVGLPLSRKIHPALHERGHEHLQDHARAVRYSTKTVLAVSAIAVLALAGFFLVARQYIGNDEGSYLYGAHLILNGKEPIKDFVSRAPFQLCLYALFILLFGSGITTLKLATTFFVGATGFIVYKTIRRYQSAAVALLGTVFAVGNIAFLLTRLVTETTNLNVVLILAACYLLSNKRNPAWANILAGMALAFAVFTRETSLIFVFGLCVYYGPWKKQWAKLGMVVLGGLIGGLPFLIFFSATIGVPALFLTLLGFGHLIVSEANSPFIYSINALIFSLISILPALIWVAAHRNHGKKSSHPARADMAPYYLWILLMILFYAYYSVKRTFMLTYGSELTPFIAIVAFSLWNRESGPKRRDQILIVLMFAVLLLPYFYLAFPGRQAMPFTQQTGVDELIGSGIPLSDYTNINDAIASVSRPGDTILTGNLLFTLQNNLVQYADITQPMIYQQGSTVYTIYNAPAPQAIAAGFQANPPKIVVLDWHLYLSLWPYLKNFFETDYTPVQHDPFGEVLMLKQSYNYPQASY